jgi:integrase/recombinase XerD
MAARDEIPGAAKFGSIWTFDLTKLRRYVTEREEQEWPRNVQKRRQAATGARILFGAAVLPRMGLLEERRDPIVLPVKDSVDLVIKRSPGMIAELIRAAIATGAREEELLKARREHIDHDRRQFTLIGKRNKRRTIDLEPFGGHDLISALPSFAGSPLLFWHSDGESYKNFASQFRDITRRTIKWAKANGVAFRPFRFHDLRHLHAVNWLKDGRSIYVLQRRLGHASIKTTELYCEFLTPEEDMIVKGLSGHKIGHIGQKEDRQEIAESLM